MFVVNVGRTKTHKSCLWHIMTFHFLTAAHLTVVMNRWGLCATCLLFFPFVVLKNISTKSTKKLWTENSCFYWIQHASMRNIYTLFPCFQAIRETLLSWSHLFLCVCRGAAPWKSWTSHRWRGKLKAFSISWPSTERNPPSPSQSECLRSRHTGCAFSHPPPPPDIVRGCFCRLVKWIEGCVCEDPFLNPELMRANPWVEKGKCVILWWSRTAGHRCTPPGLPCTLTQPRCTNSHTSRL